MNIEKLLYKIVRERENRKRKLVLNLLVLVNVFIFGILMGGFFIQNELVLTGQVTGNLPDVGESNWGTILNNYLLQEHTVNGTHGNVTVEGSLNVSGDVTDYSGGVISIPSGFIGMFNTTSCPNGWSEMTESKGRYFVSLPNSGTLGVTIGTNLSDGENREVGQHNHDATGLTFVGNALGNHNHGIRGAAIGTLGGGSPHGVGQGTGTNSESVSAGTPSGTISGNTATNGSVAGTNAPYIQVLVCVKN